MHFLPDDPIVYPGQPGKSHDHTFVGNTSTNASSTLASLRAAGTTCHLQADKAAYWMPTLIVDGQPVTPLGATIYYRRNTMARVHAFPAGLEMIAGDSKAITPQDMKITFWNCGVDSGIAAVVGAARLPEHEGRRAAAPRQLPELLGREGPGQRRPQEPHGLSDARRVPGRPSRSPCPRSA